MPVSKVGFTQVNLELTDVVDVVLTEIVQDPLVGDWVRDVRIMGTPAVGTESVMIAQLRLRSPNRAPLVVTAPAQEF